jgi:hypothetical protein
MHVFVVEERPDPSEDWSVTCVLKDSDTVRAYLQGNYLDNDDDDALSLNTVADGSAWVEWKRENTLARATRMEVE